MSAIILQKVTIEDIPALLSIEEKLNNLKTYSAMITAKEWEDEFNKDGSTIYFILNNGVIVGDVSYEKRPDGTAYISGLGICPQFQHKGIGTEATRLILEELKDIKTIRLATHPENSIAIKLYLSFGFIITTRKENYFGDGEPRIIMVKENLI